MKTIERLMEHVERYRTAGGREEHYAYKDMLQCELENTLQDNSRNVHNTAIRMCISVVKVAKSNAEAVALLEAMVLPEES